jgi:hypothetical protein
MNVDRIRQVTGGICRGIASVDEYDFFALEQVQKLGGANKNFLRHAWFQGSDARH